MEVKDYAEVLGCKTSKLPMNYLGLPLDAKRQKQTVWSGAMARVRRRLGGWKRACLSKGGRLTLLKSVLTSIPVYTMSLFKMPSKVGRSLEKLQRDFLWGSDEENKKIHLVKWEMVKQPLHRGGLGVRSLLVLNKALLGKWLWRFAIEKKALWRRVVAEKYGLQGRGRRTRTPMGRAGIGLWKDIMKEWDSFASEVRVDLGKGTDTAFWTEVWVGEEALAQSHPNIYNLAKHKNFSVEEAKTGNAGTTVWNIVLKRNLYDWEMDEWMSLMKILYEWQGTGEGEDHLLWKRAKSGLFTVKDNYARLETKVRRSTDEGLPWKGVWKTGCPTKVAFFTWEVTLGKVLTLDNLKRRGFALVNRCYLCKKSEETINHLFLRCEWAEQLWKAAITSLGVQWVQAQSVKGEL